MQQVNEHIKEHWGSVLSLLIAWLGDIELAEDVLNEAVIQALEHWSSSGVPHNPRAWLLKTAKNKAVDIIRRQDNYRAKLNELPLSRLYDDIKIDDPHEIPDERLRLMFTCAHPALKTQSQVALILHTVAGLTTEQIAQAYLVKKSTIAQRLVRAKQKIKKAKIPYCVPQSSELGDRVDQILNVIYLIFNEGYQSHFSKNLASVNLIRESLALVQVMIELMPALPEILGLGALILFHDSRTPARLNGAGGFVPLSEQDRTLWDQEKIKRGDFLLTEALRMKGLGTYQIQAAMSAVHCHALEFSLTDWKQLDGLYAKLYELQPSPVVQLNWIYVVYQRYGSKKALADLKVIEETGLLDNYHSLYALKGELLVNAGQFEKAIEAYKTAIRLSSNQVEIDYLRSQINSLMQEYS